MNSYILKYWVSPAGALLYLISILFCVSSNAIETKIFNSEKSARDPYLSFTPPPALRFSGSKIIADRLMLKGLPSLVAESDFSNTVSTMDENASMIQIDYPIVDFDSEVDVDEDESESVTKPKDSVPSASNQLPQADPFTNDSIGSVNSTEELLKLFDQTQSVQPVQRFAVPFNPPFTITSDPMYIESKSSYMKIKR